MAQTLDLKVEEAWESALDTWNSPTVPQVISPRTKEEIADLGEIGQALSDQLAFMHYPDCQTYLNLGTITGKTNETMY